MQKINRKLFGVVHKQITEHPEVHDQRSWEWRDAPCGTTRCAGGWALHHYAVAKGWTELNLWQIASVVTGGKYASVRRGAAKALGLTEEEAHRLFYTFDKDKVTDMVRLYATGGRAAVNRKYGFVN
jgi:hypothetical protein